MVAPDFGRRILRRKIAEAHHALLPSGAVRCKTMQRAGKFTICGNWRAVIKVPSVSVTINIRSKARPLMSAKRGQANPRMDLTG
jgi:hypothetical protein